MLIVIKPMTYRASTDVLTVAESEPVELLVVHALGKSFSLFQRKKRCGLALLKSQNCIVMCTEKRYNCTH